jgi:hypothetical protein
VEFVGIVWYFSGGKRPGIKMLGPAGGWFCLVCSPQHTRDTNIILRADSGGGATFPLFFDKEKSSWLSRSCCVDGKMYFTLDFI